MTEKIIDGIKYRLDEDNLTAAVTCLLAGDSLEDYAGDINIPKIVKFHGVSYLVTSIDSEAFEDCKSLTSITIPDSVTSIGYDAFLGCDSLTQNPIQEIEFDNVTYRLLMHNHLAMILTAKDEIIDIPAEIPYEGVSYRVVSIDPGAFAGCSSLTSITIPNSVTSIGDEAFADCDLLKSITISESVTSISNSAFANCCSLTSIVVAEGNTVYDSRENCNAIIEKSNNTIILGCQKTTIPNSVKRIGDEAFASCSSLTSIVIPNSVTSIGDEAFRGCSKLANITIPDSVTTIGKSAFMYCESLTSVTIPSSVTSIGQGATFQKCTSLQSVQWNATNCTIDKNSDGHRYPPFANLSNIKNFTFGNNVKSIPACLCYELSGLTSIVIPNSVTSIGDEAFRGCSSLKAIDIPDSVMIIEACAFLGCKSLKIIALPSNALIIEDGAFADCNSWRVIRYSGTVKQCESRYRYWDQCFHHEIIYCTDGDKQIHW